MLLPPDGLQGAGRAVAGQTNTAVESMRVESDRENVKIAYSFLLFGLLFLAACGAQAETRDNPVDGKTLVRVPAGEFTMGVTPEQEQALVKENSSAAGLFDMEKPSHLVNVADFWIDRDLVTNIQYKKFLDANPDYPIPTTDIEQMMAWSWDPDTRAFPKDRDTYPVVLVSWYDANAYCEWAGMRLPTEAEWEKAARGTDGRLYPWGNSWDDSKSAAGRRGATEAAPVGRFPAGASPFTVNDMVGNVWQWTSSAFRPYPYNAADGREDPSLLEERVVRGSMFAFGPTISRTNVRSQLKPDEKATSVGFRCAI